MNKPGTAAEQLFGEALNMPKNQRASFLDAACRDDHALRRLVERLLEENDRLGGLLSTPVYANDDATRAPRDYLSSGSRLGRYEIIKLLGAGGMGVVYLAYDGKLERTVAIKMLAPDLLVNDAVRHRFRQEALALAKVNHPSIAAVYDVGEEGGRDFIVMEFVPGEPLAAKLRSGPIELLPATKLVFEVLDALSEAHARGVVHRDLKPGNIMITPKGQAKVLDFGLAKLLAADADVTATQVHGIAGTPLYMSPEQALGHQVDSRTDIWSLGVIYYEALTGQTPFRGESSLAVLRSITQTPFTPVRQFCPNLPPLAGEVVARALEKDPARRYQTAAEMEHEVEKLRLQISPITARLGLRSMRWVFGPIALILAVAGFVGWQLYDRVSERRWAHAEAPGQIEKLIETRKPLEAQAMVERAQRDLPGDTRLKEIEDEDTELVKVSSEPAGATVAIQDYTTPKGPWKELGTTPIASVRIPKGFFRWRVSKSGVGEMVTAAKTDPEMQFPLAQASKAPAGMVYVPAATWTAYEAFLGWLGPYQLPAYYIDRTEVTNREYQQFVDIGGYANQRYWPAQIQKDGRRIPWNDAITGFRDTTDRPGPSTWIGGHYPDGQADYPVSGVSWYEAAAYAAWTGKSLPVLGQWYQASQPDLVVNMAPLSNFSGAVAPVGAYQGLGPYGTYDMAGNVREWVANTVDDSLRFALGGSWQSQPYVSSDPEAFSPTGRSAGNGFRCVMNLSPLPDGALQPYRRIARDFAKVKPASEDVFRAYQVIYRYDKTPLNVKNEGVVKETPDWREEKVSFDAAYSGERVTAYLFLPKRVQPPYQTVLFFPSARVYFLPPDSSNLGDTKFFDYIVQSGRAVVYPVYEDTYERRLKYTMPGGSQSVTLTADWYKDSARTLDYLATRKDIDSSRLAYLGVSMGAADGVIVASLLQDRLRTAVWLDGGYFLGPPPPGGDQVDFVVRMKKPVLMVNGRYDYTFPLDKAQNPMFQMLGTPPADKSHVVLDTPHDVTDQRPILVNVVLNWLDKYLGRVGS